MGLPPRRARGGGRRIKVEFGGHVIAETTGAPVPERAIHRTTTSRPATSCRAPWDALTTAPSASGRGGPTTSTSTPGTGRGGRAWGYDNPTASFEAIAGYVAFYAGRMDACWVGDELVVPQPGGFYGGWITWTWRAPSRCPGQPGLVTPIRPGLGSPAPRRPPCSSVGPRSRPRLSRRRAGSRRRRRRRGSASGPLGRWVDQAPVDGGQLQP